VLDTFEHVVDAAPFVAELAVACPRVTFLVTSRAPLHVRGEHEMHIAPLSVPPVTIGVTGLSDYPATALFLERAQAVKPDLAPDQGMAAAIVAVCRRLDGLPLALELAAVRLRHLPLTVVREELEHRLNLLVSGPRDLPPRHQQMRQTIRWSYDLLDPRQRRLFRELSVFAGGWTPAAAESICTADADALLQDVTVLVDNNLVTTGEDADAEPRFGMLDVIREFAIEEAESHTDAIELRRRHATAFAELAEVAEPGLVGSTQEAWYRRLQADQDNMRAAIAWALESEPCLAQRIAGALWQFWRRDGQYTEARLLLDRALAVDERRDPAEECLYRRKVLWGDAWISFYQGDYAHASRLGDELLGLAQAGDDQVGVRNGLTIRGIVAMAEQRITDALAPLEKAERICREVCPPWLLATSLLNLGMAAMHASDLVRSGTLLREALRRYHEVGDKLFVARTTAYLGYVAMLGGNPRVARRHLTDSLQAFHELGERFGAAEGLQAMSVLSAAERHDEKAAELAGAAHTMWTTMSAQPLASDRALAIPYLDAARRRIGASAHRSGVPRCSAGNRCRAIRR
jgi:predicted ATPase